MFVSTEPVHWHLASALRWIVRESLHVGDAILVADGRRVAVVGGVATAAPLSLADAAGAFLAVKPRTASALVRCLPVATILADVDLDLPAPGGPVTFCLF